MTSLGSRTAASLAATALALVVACRHAPRGGEPARAPALVLISIDGFRADYLDRFPTPTLRALARRGVRADALVPVFPAKTFPNHYSMVTGLFPAHHGIVSNRFVDPSDGRLFAYSDTNAVRDGRWWGGEPIWVTAERQGRRAAAFFWPGSEAAIGAVRPSVWKRYDDRVPNADRVDSVLAWLSLPDDRRPDLVALYFSDVDTWGHERGPDSPEVAAAAAHVDTMLARLLRGLERRGLADRVNVVVVSDHGMITTSRARVVLLDDYADTARVRRIEMGEFVALEPRDGDVEALMRVLARVPHVRFFRRHETPERWRYRDNRRIASVVGVADDGWTFTTRRSLPRIAASGGGHGYDPASPEMGGLFVAAGPAFRQGVRAPAFGAVHVYEILCAALGLSPAPNDGSRDSVRAVLR